jgi:hypothetical protein
MTTWTEVTQGRYYAMLEMLPPAIQTADGFLVGEARRHRDCAITGQFRAAYAAFVEREGRYFEADAPLTVPEFQNLKFVAPAPTASTLTQRHRCLKGKH